MVLLKIIKERTVLVLAVGVLATGWVLFLLDEPAVYAAEGSRSILEEEGKGLMKNVEEMVAHGGMGMQMEFHQVGNVLLVFNHKDFSRH